MTVHQPQPLDEFERLRTEAAIGRLRAIRSQIATGITFCSIADCQLRSGNTEHLDTVIAKLRKLAGTIRRHLNEPKHVPSGEAEKVLPELAQLESRILAVEAGVWRNRK